MTVPMHAFVSTSCHISTGDRAAHPRPISRHRGPAATLAELPLRGVTAPTDGHVALTHKAARSGIAQS